MYESSTAALETGVDLRRATERNATGMPGSIAAVENW